MNPYKLFILGALFLFIGCNGQKKTAMQQETLAMNDKLQLLVSNDYSGVDVPETLVIKDNKALESFYAKINVTRKPGLPIPQVDFKEDMIIVVCSGERNDGSSQLLSVAEVTASQLVLATSLQLDKKNTSTAITSPFNIYKLPLTDKEIVIQSGN